MVLLVLLELFYIVTVFTSLQLCTRAHRPTDRFSFVGKAPVPPRAHGLLHRVGRENHIRSSGGRHSRQDLVQTPVLPHLPEQSGDRVQVQPGGHDQHRPVDPTFQPGLVQAHHGEGAGQHSPLPSQTLGRSVLYPGLQSSDQQLRPQLHLPRQDRPRSDYQGESA